MESPGGLASEEVRDIAREHYLNEDLNRPPFKYSEREPRFKKADETRIFQIEHKVFNCVALNQVPSPPENINPSSPLSRAYQILLNSTEPFKQSIRYLNGFTFLSEEECGKAPNVDREKSLVIGMEFHYRKKKKYLQSLIAYLSIYLRTPHTEGREKAALLFDEAETIFLAHQSYAVVRSFSHDYGPLREDGDTVMKHVYDVSISVINHFMQLISEEEDTAKKRTLYDRMKVNMVVAIAHDLKEDHRHLLLDVIHDTMIRETGFDTRLINLVYAGGLEGGDLRINIHFIKRKWREIKRKMIALTKPREKSQRNGYLKKQILNGSLKNLVEQLDVVLIKIFDRDSNITSLSYMKGKPGRESAEETQNRKIVETIDILDIANQIYDQISDPGLLREMEFLCEACMTESLRLTKHHQTQIEEQGIEDDVDIARNLIAIELKRVLKKSGLI